MILCGEEVSKILVELAKTKLMNKQIINILYKKNKSKYRREKIFNNSIC